MMDAFNIAGTTSLPNGSVAHACLQCGNHVTLTVRDGSPTRSGMPADTTGNVFGRWEAGSESTVLAGSNLDTVPQGGPFDGTLSVCAALEAVRTLKEATSTRQ